MRHTILHIILFAVLLTPSVSRAQPSDDAADVGFKRGAELFRQGQYEAARSTLAQAFARKQTFDIAVALGFAEVKLEHWRAAATSLAWALRHWAPTGKPASRDSATHWLEEAKKRVGTIRLHLNVTGSRVAIDGAHVDPDEIEHELFVDPGSHTIVAQHDGYQDAQATVRARTGSAQKVALSLTPLAPDHRSIVPGVVLGSVAGVALATGVGLFVAYQDKRSDANDLNGAIVKAGGTCVNAGAHYDARCSQLESTAKSADTMHSAAVGLLVGAGAAAAGTALYFLWPTSKPARTGASTLRLAPLASPSTGGVLFSGSF